MAIQLRERPHTSAGAPNYSRLGWMVVGLAVCLVALGGGARLLLEPAPKPAYRLSEQGARKQKPAQPTSAPQAAQSAAIAPGAQGRSVRVIPTDRTPVASIAAPDLAPDPAPGSLDARATARAFADVQRAEGAAYQGFKTVAGR